jgi:large subunit ribosomal protein L46
MNTWVVGRVPVGHLSYDFVKPQTSASGIELNGQKTFFLKARIMAGQANLKGNAFGLKDFKWLCKEEVQKVVSPGYWSKVKNMLTER